MHVLPFFTDQLSTRRRFLASSAAAVCGLAAPWPDRVHDPRRLRVDGARLRDIWASLRRFGGTRDGGTTRLAYSDEDLAARDYVAGVMEQAGLDVSVDLAGNLVGRRGGAGSDSRPLVTGSHVDTVPAGGSYDGQIGVAAALEAALTLRDAGAELRHPLEVVVFQNEEGGKTGSRALVGRVQPAELDIVTASGFTIREGTARLGGDPSRLAEARREAGSVLGFLELHVEQGGYLETEGIQIGVVEGIVGIRRWNVEVQGAANHAGTTPMGQRRDALVAAASLIQAVDDTARSMEGRSLPSARSKRFPERRTWSPAWSEPRWRSGTCAWRRSTRCSGRSSAGRAPSRKRTGFPSSSLASTRALRRPPLPASATSSSRRRRRSATPTPECLQAQDTTPRAWPRSAPRG